MQTVKKLVMLAKWFNFKDPDGNLIHLEQA